MVLLLKGGEQKEVCGGKARVPLPKEGTGEGAVAFKGQGVKRERSGVICSLSCVSVRSDLKEPVI